MAEFRLSPAAKGDLDRIFDDTAERWGLDQALHYLDVIEAACVRLANAPEQGQGCDDIRPGYRRLGAGHHRIYYRPADYGIAVIRILHERMNAIRHI